jgi:hypothetical protein
MDRTVFQALNRVKAIIVEENEILERKNMPVTSGNIIKKAKSHHLKTRWIYAKVIGNIELVFCDGPKSLQ